MRENFKHGLMRGCWKQNESFAPVFYSTEAIWRVIYADGRIDKYEDYLVRKLSRLMELKHNELIDAKIRARK